MLTCCPHSAYFALTFAGWLKAHNKMERIVLMILVLVLPACRQKESGSLGKIAIRITNNSAYRFEEVYVKGPEDTHQYGAIAPGASSTYKTFEAAYKYAYLKLKINGETFILSLTITAAKTNWPLENIPMHWMSTIIRLSGW
jgi:hypothetical protein